MYSYWFFLPRHSNAMVSGDIKVAMRVSIGIRVTKAIARCVLSISKKKENMSSNNDYDYTERENKVLELYDSGKSTRDIAKILRMSLRDISFILKNGEVNHGIAITATDNNKSSNGKATQAYRLYDEVKKPVEVAIQLCLSEKEATRYYKEYWKLKRLYKLHQLYIEIEYCLP